MLIHGLRTKSIVIKAESRNQSVYGLSEINNGQWYHRGPYNQQCHSDHFVSRIGDGQWYHRDLYKWYSIYLKHLPIYYPGQWEPRNLYRIRNITQKY